MFFMWLAHHRDQYLRERRQSNWTFLSIENYSFLLLKPRESTEYACSTYMAVGGKSVECSLRDPIKELIHVPTERWIIIL